jgi:hypothetical protein
LIQLLSEKQHVDPAIISANLKIIQGSATDIQAVKSVLAFRPAMIISGIGGLPRTQMKLSQPIYFDQPTICADFTATMFAALHELSEVQKPIEKPFLIIISTTGISSSRDTPYIIEPFYKTFLHTPHLDKKNMEDASMKELMSEDSVISGLTVVRASLLTDGGLGVVRSGWERHEQDVDQKESPGPAIGYTISRAAVGKWIFDNLVHGSTSEWNRRMVSLTH